MPDYSTIIIGAGPAGLFAALHAAQAGAATLILEKTARPGQKLLLTGSGQCNFTNGCTLKEFLAAYGDHGRFLKNALYFFSNQAVIDFFRQQGIEPEMVEKTQKIFPRSRKASDILGALVQACESRQIEIACNRQVTALTRDAAGFFVIHTDSKRYHARQVVIATGGQSYPGTGSTGDGYALAQSLGHRIIPPRPGLTSLAILDHPLGDLAGTSFQNMSVTLWRSGKKIRQLSGDLVITHHGVSGPVIQNLSRYAAPLDLLCLSFLGAVNPETFRSVWMAQFQKSGRMKIRQWLTAQTPTRALGEKIIALLSLDPQMPLAQLNQDRRNLLYQHLSAFPLPIKSLGDFSSAMVTCGGITLDEVDPKSMASRLVPGLYFAGEVLDIDGDCGGFDLQAAWSTGALAGHAITKSLA